MALAEPRRREKWGANVRGMSWSNDQDKLGLKMMQKLGYESGKGLGKNKDGMITPLTARQKMDSKGIGFNGHDDTWLAHQDDFQALLASLNVEHGNAEAQEAGKKSLEKLSKKSKKRVHYQKFTRGKDLANYSKDDLGCILGTKSEKLKTMQKEKKEKEEKKLEEESADKQPETQHGVITLQGGNYHDYFQKKMALLKAKGLPTFGDNQIKQENSEEDTSNSDNQESSEVTSPAPISTHDLIEEEPTPKKKKKSKKEKKEKESEQKLVTADKENIEVANEDTNEKSSKKKKKSKEIAVVEEETESVKQEKSEKKKKKKKDKSRDTEEEMVVQENVFVEKEIKKKKNKKQEKEQVEDETEGCRKRSHEEVELEGEEPSKKRKKNKKDKKCADDNPEKSSKSASNKS